MRWLHGAFKRLIERLSERLLRMPLPHSIVVLVTTGFGLVALPLAVAVVLAMLYLDELTSRSQALVARDVQLSRRSEQLVIQLNDMERNARQYLVLEDPALLDLYRDNHALFNARLDILERLTPADFTRDNFASMRDAARALLDLLLSRAEASPDDTEPATTAALTEYLTRLRNLALALASFSNRTVDERLQALLNAANRAEARLFWLALSLIPVALLGGMVYVVLITHPVRCIRAAIQTLGTGDLSRPVVIPGPRELHQVGLELDWLRHRLLDLETQKNRFLRHISHELKTPLASIREGAELLVDGTVGTLTPAQTEVADIVRGNSIELQSLIDNLLSFNAWQQQRLRLRVQRLQPLLSELASRYRLMLTTKRLTLHLSTIDRIVRVDRQMLITALDNLLSNAIKFTPEGGDIRIESFREADSILIDVIDTGPGIAPADRERIFEPFVSSSAPTDTRLRGTGIGLSVARECIEAHHGTIEVVDSVRSGAHFRIRLPAQPD